ncbi:MAG: hypothetical protein Q9162_005636 [Coniocarpon cinnabarinum]
MASFSFALSLILLTLKLFQCTNAQTWPPEASYVAPLGLATDPKFSTTAKRDGGGGGYVNGFHLVGFCDSTTQSEQFGGVTSFAHNSFAYMGYDNVSDPTDLWNFGNVTEAQSTYTSMNFATGSGTFGNMFSSAENETGSFAMWTTGNYVPSHDDKQALGIMTCLDEGATNQVYYNTLVGINVTDPKDTPSDDNTLSGERLVPRLFYGTENLYGSFTLYKALDNFLYLFGTSQSFMKGINVARVPFDSLTDRNTYNYWNGAEWSSAQPDMHDASSNILNFTDSMGNGPNTGEVFFSHYHNQTMSVFTDGGVGGTFWMTYPMQGEITDRWSEPVELYTPPAPTETCDSGHQWNYAGHAYPDWDQSGKTLLLSWSSCESYIHMATVVWE